MYRVQMHVALQLFARTKTDKNSIFNWWWEKNANSGCWPWCNSQVGSSFWGEFTVENHQEAFVGVFGFLWVLQVLLYQHLSCVDVACILETRKHTWYHNEHQMLHAFWRPKKCTRYHNQHQMLGAAQLVYNVSFVYTEGLLSPPHIISSKISNN